MRGLTALLWAVVGLAGSVPAGAAEPPAPHPEAAPVKIVQDCRPQIDTLVVCGRRVERSPYRIPILHDGFDPDGPVDSVSRERHRLFEVGETGIGSCSNAGAGGWTGCGTLEFKQFHQQHDGNTRVGFGVKPAKGDF